MALRTTRHVCSKGKQGKVHERAPANRMPRRISAVSDMEEAATKGRNGVRSADNFTGLRLFEA
jgi:hypothetical protein